MKKIKEEKGITLVALIITIVVLLILAMAGIGAIQDSKIIAHAQNAAGSFNQAKNNEVDFITKYEEEIEKHINAKNNVKSGYYIHDRVDVVGARQIWYVELKETNKVHIKYYLIQDNSVSLDLDLGEVEIKEENTKNENLTNYIDGSPITIEPNYYVLVGAQAYIKENKLFAADDPEDDNTPYVVAILDEEFVLPE